MILYSKVFKDFILGCMNIENFKKESYRCHTKCWIFWAPWLQIVSHVTAGFTTEWVIKIPLIASSRRFLDSPYYTRGYDCETNPMFLYCSCGKVVTVMYANNGHQEADTYNNHLFIGHKTCTVLPTMRSLNKNNNPLPPNVTSN